MGGSLLFALALTAFSSTYAADATVAAVAQRELDQLPGHTGFAFCELANGEPQLLAGVRQDERFAVGSSFKLFILGTLAKDVNEHRRDLANFMRLEAHLVGPPHSELADWPTGSPVTINTLALKMISISDNTATDHLHYLLGREGIEHQMRTMIGEHAEWNIPLLSTREMTMLRDKNQGLPGLAYNKLDVPGRRDYLAKLDAGRPDYESLDFDTAAYNLAEWYATPLDMANAMAWLHRHTREEQPAHALRGILAIDPKMAHDPAVWPYIGFKGGSEDQLLAGNWLLKHKNGRWYTLDIFYNNPGGKADQEKLLSAITAIFSAITDSLK
jgi:beta-lactamase class A